MFSISLLLTDKTKSGFKQINELNFNNNPKKKKKTNLFIYLLNNEIKRGFKQINQAKKEDAKPK